VSAPAVAGPAPRRGPTAGRGAGRVADGVAPVPVPFALEHGGAIGRGGIAWRSAGPDGAPAVLVLGGISADRRVLRAPGEPEPGWWDALAGPGRALDTRALRVLGIDVPGGRGGSASPDAPPGPPAGAITTADQARLIGVLLDTLGIDALHACVGASYGGMVALALAAHAPDRVLRIVAIGAADAPHPMATALRSLQRRIVRLGIETGRAQEGLRIARGLGITSYRTREEFGERFEAAAQWADDRLRFAVEDYLEHQGDRFAAVCPPDAYLRLSESLDLHRVDASAVTVPTTLVGTPSDALVPIEQVRGLAERIAGPCTLHEVASRYGHDAFLKETGAIGRIVAGALAGVRS
jgi:homoserine O-acetyltransferase